MMSAVSELLPPKVRAIIYVVAAMLAGAWLVIVENANLHWGWVAAYSAWSIGTHLLAAANTSQTNFAQQAALQRDLEVAAQVRALSGAPDLT
jgi:hypothetical protein